MTVRYDQLADTLFIRFTPGKISKSVPVSGSVIVDLDMDGFVVGLETLDVSLQPNLVDGLCELRQL